MRNGFVVKIRHKLKSQANYWHAGLFTASLQKQRSCVSVCVYVHVPVIKMFTCWA